MYTLRAIDTCGELYLFDRKNPVHLVRQMLQGIKKGWDALSDCNPEFPHVSLVSSMETCNSAFAIPR
jgi:hypothetical protein